MTRITDSEVFALPLLVEHYNGMAAAVNSLTTGYGLTCACLQWRVGGRRLSLTPGSEFYIPEPMDAFASFSGVSDMFDLANHLGFTGNGPPALPKATEVPQNCMVMFVGGVSGGVTGATANTYDAQWHLVSLGSVTVSYTGTLTPQPFSPGDLARGIAPAGRGWTPGPAAKRSSGRLFRLHSKRVGWLNLLVPGRRDDLE